MASNVHTMEGTPPDTAGPRGPRLSPAQARALRMAHGASIYKVRLDEMVGRLPMSFEPGQIYAYVATKSTEPVHIIGAATGDALIKLGLWVPLVTLCGQPVYRSTNEAAAALRAGNIG